jgi:hypothetical protein
MSISSIALSRALIAPTVSRSERTEPAGVPDHDGDADDGGQAVSASGTSAIGGSLGRNIDLTA